MHVYKDNKLNFDLQISSNYRLKDTPQCIGEISIT